MKLITIIKNETPFIHTMPEFDNILIYPDADGNIHLLDVCIHFFEGKDRHVSTVIVASEEVIDSLELKKIAMELDYLD